MILQGTTTHVVRVVRVARAVAFGGRQPPKGFGVEGEWGERGEGWPPFFVFSKKKHRNIRVARVVRVARAVAFGGRQPPKSFGVEGEWGERGEGWPPFFFKKKIIAT